MLGLGLRSNSVFINWHELEARANKGAKNAETAQELIKGERKESGTYEKSPMLVTGL